MDKNTLTGLLLIGALLMGFMYCNRPDVEEMKTNPVESTSTALPTDDRFVDWELLI